MTNVSNPNLDVDNLKRISHLFRGGWMVPGRLSHLINTVDFNHINTVFDIGSWHLEQSIEFIACLDHVRVHAFEPHPESAQQCRKNKETIVPTHRHRIDIHELALTDKIGEISFYALDTDNTASKNVGMSSTLKISDENMRGDADGKWLQKEIRVKATTLDKWCSDTGIYPDALWVDVQGAELDLYRGGQNVLRDHVKIVFTEVGVKPYYDGHGLKPDIDQMMKELGFVELKSAFKMNDEYEADAIYIKPSIIKNNQ